MDTEALATGIVLLIHVISLILILVMTLGLVRKDRK